MTILDYSIVIVYLIGMVAVGLFFQRRASDSIDSYFLGNRKMPWWALGASGMASNLDISGTMINTAFVFAIGAAGFFIRGGVTLIMAFLMIFQGKWNRRAEVMTLAEWMHFRFGKDKQGDTARLIAAFSIIIMTIAMITYFAIGSGKFVFNDSFGNGLYGSQRIIWCCVDRRFPGCSYIWYDNLYLCSECRKF